MRHRIELRRIATLQGLVVGIALALFVVAGVLTWQTRDLNRDPALDNRAQLEQTTETGVVTVVSRGLVQVLSYDHTQPEATRAFADLVLDGQAREQYDTLFASLAERAPDQELVLSAAVQVAGIQELTRDRAELLVFLDQRSTRAGDEEASVSAAQLSVTAERRDRTWVITELQPL